MRIVTHISKALAAFFMLAALALAPAAGAASHDCCLEKAPAVMMPGMDGPCPHAAQMQQADTHSGHEKAQPSCGMACCAGLAASMILPDAPVDRADISAPSQLHTLMADTAVSVPLVIVTPPPRLLTRI